MKKFLFLLFIWLGFVAFTVFKTIKVDNSEVNQITALLKNGCSNDPARVELLSTSPEFGLRKLGEIEEKCKSQVATQMMYFTIMPKDAIDASILADKVSITLKNFQDAQIEPLVIVEPDSQWGLIDFSEFSTGFWDPFLDAFFADLKAGGITDQMMGTWVPFPEANLPYWNHQNTSPELFASNINRYVKILKKHFPNAKVSILLNSATYPTDDYNWADGEYVSLRPYLQNIERGTIDSFGIQGFPWMPAVNDTGKPLFEPKEWLNTPIIAEAADLLGTKKIWFNTGTFAAKYTLDNEAKVTIPADIRAQILEKILEQAKTLKRDGYQVNVNIFAQDKSEVTEATDWSYLGSAYTEDNSHTLALLGFLKKAFSTGIPVSLYLGQ